MLMKSISELLMYIELVIIHLSKQLNLIYQMCLINLGVWNFQYKFEGLEIFMESYVRTDKVPSSRE